MIVIPSLSFPITKRRFTGRLMGSSSLLVLPLLLTLIQQHPVTILEHVGKLIIELRTCVTCACLYKCTRRQGHAGRCHFFDYTSPACVPWKAGCKNTHYYTRSLHPVGASTAFVFYALPTKVRRSKNCLFSPACGRQALKTNSPTCSYLRCSCGYASRADMSLPDS